MFMPSGILPASVQGAPGQLTLIVLPSFIAGFEQNCPITEGPAEAFPNGGTEPYSYAWDWESGGTFMTINSPTSKTTTITKNDSGSDSGVLRCTVTDNNTDTAVYTIPVDLECGT